MPDPRIIQTPDGVSHEFPADATDAEISAALNGEPTPAAAPEGGIGRVLETAGAELNPVTLVQGLVAAAKDPKAAARALWESHKAVYQKSLESEAKGEYADALVHALNSYIPLIGPKIDELAERGAAGDTSGMIGGAIGTGLSLGAPAIVKGAAAGIGRLIPGAPTMRAGAAVSRAVATGERYGVPADAATATGNPVVAHLQKLADTSLGGAITGQASREAQAAGLERMGTGLAQQAGPVAIPESAGAAVKTGVQGALERQAGVARAAYDDLAQLEAANTQTIQVGTQKTPTGVVPVMKTIGLPTDMRPVKAVLAPLEDEFNTIPAVQQNASPGLALIRQILNGDDWMPASQADKILSQLKRIGREAGEIPQLRGVSGWIASKGVQALSPAVDAAVAQGGAAATNALQVGRVATKLKFELGQLYRTISKEPVKAFQGATLARDQGISKLRAIATAVPGAIPKVGRALLDKVMSGAEGGPQAQLAFWNRLGPATKAILFPDAAHRAALDDYFLLAKKIAENPQPSGSALSASLGLQTGAAFFEPLSTLGLGGAGGYALSKLFHSAAGVRFLTQGMSLPPKSAAAAAWLAKLTARLQQAKAVLPSAPMAPVPVPAAENTPAESAP